MLPTFDLASQRTRQTVILASKLMSLLLKISGCAVWCVVQGLRADGADSSEVVVGQNMTAFTADIWTTLRAHAPTDSDFVYTLRYDRNEMPSESVTDLITTRVRPYNRLISSVSKSLDAPLLY